MDTRSTARIRCAMIVYELEVALGNYVRTRSDRLGEAQTAKEIMRRAGSADSGITANLVVENSYLAEILALAVVVAKGTSDATPTAHIEKLATALDLFDIRNAIAHPNRPFAECYWYRCATIAADPCIDALHFSGVSQAFRNAESGTLREPPEEWLYKKRWTVPADIPEESDFSLTGLIGRTRDESKLAKDLRSRKSPLLALVAKGGVGKTSLLQQCAQTLCLSPDAGEYFDAVIWASLKQEALTKDGVQLLTAPASVSEMEAALSRSLQEVFGLPAGTFSETAEKVAEKRVLLCLDNLETILRDSPEQFHGFYDELPEMWKVVVTTRIPVDGAKNLPIDALDSSGATALARSYLQTKSGQAPESQVIERIVSGTKSNPLAIKLTADRYLLGASLDEALATTEQDVLEFSFTSLLEHLSRTSQEILEVVFALDNPTRSDLCSCLERSVDEVAEAVGQLSKVSLISRRESEGKEVYALADSIRDLLRANPRDLGVRKKAGNWSARDRDRTSSALRYQSGVNASPLSVFYITENTPSHLIEFSRRLRTGLRQEDRSKVVDIERELRHRLATGDRSAFLYRTYAQCVAQLGDYPTAITHFQKAAALDLNDPAPTFSLAMIYSEQGKIDDVRACTTRLVEQGWAELNRAGANYAARLWGLHLHALCVLDQYEEVFKLTAEWEEHATDIPNLAVGRASALRRLAGKTQDRGAAEELLGDAALCFFKVILHHGYPRWLSSEYRKLLRELGRHFDSGSLAPNLRARMYITNMLRLAPPHSEAFHDAGILLDTIANQPSAESVADALLRLKHEGYTIGKIKPGYRTHANFFFAQDAEGVDYYVNNSAMDAMEIRKRVRAGPGTDVALQFEAASSGGNGIPATKAILVV